MGVIAVSVFPCGTGREPGIKGKYKKKERFFMKKVFHSICAFLLSLTLMAGPHSRRK